MPNVNVTLPETSETISRPIVFDIVNQVSKITKINKDTDVFFPGDIGHMRTAGSSIDDSGRYPIFNTSHRTFVEVNEEFNENDFGSTAVGRNEHVPIFFDKNLGVILTPVYASTDVEISFNYNTPSKTEALRWRDDVRMRMSQLRDINLHDLTYQYLLPLEFLVLIKTIWEKREAVAGYGETFEEYLLGYTIDSLTVIGDLIGDAARLSIGETQCRVIGIFGFEGVPEKPERSDNGLWSIKFTYKFTYDKPIACNLKYPIMVHNQLLPISYTNFIDKSYDIDAVDKSYRKSLKALHGFEIGNIMSTKVDKDAITYIPNIDTFKPDNVPVGTGSILYALSEVDVNDKKTLLSLQELGDIVLDPDIVQFMLESELPYLNLPYKSVLLVSMYRNKNLVFQDDITIDNQLNVSSVNELDLRNQHRVRLSITSDLSLLDHRAVTRLRNYPKALVAIVKAINSVFRNDVDLSYISRKRRVTASDFSIIHGLITGFGNANGSNSGIDLLSDRNISLTQEQQRLMDEYRSIKIQHNQVMESSVIAISRQSGE